MSHVDDVSDDALASELSAAFTPTTDPDTVPDADMILVCIPTPFDAMKGTGSRHVRAAGATIARRLRRGALVVLQSTTYPGTTVEVAPAHPRA